MASYWSYWKTLETISPKTIEDDALRDFRIALIGEPEHRAAVREALITDKATPWEREDAANYLREYDKSPDADVASAFLFRIYTAAPGEPLGVRGPNSVPIAGTLDRFNEELLQDQTPINTDTYGAGWLFEMTGDAGATLTVEDYYHFLSANWENTQRLLKGRM